MYPNEQNAPRKQLQRFDERHYLSPGLESCGLACKQRERVVIGAGVLRIGYNGTVVLLLGVTLWGMIASCKVYNAETEADIES